MTCSKLEIHIVPLQTDRNPLKMTCQVLPAMDAFSVSLTTLTTTNLKVSTTPHLEHRIHLTVIQPVTAILGPPELYIEKGSTINLTCIIKAGPLNLNPSYVFWNYNGKIITYDRERGGTVVISEKREQTTSSLIITHATSKDSGQYECDPSASYPQHVNVHVIKRGLDPTMH